MWGDLGDFLAGIGNMTLCSLLFFASIATGVLVVLIVDVVAL